MDYYKADTYFLFLPKFAVMLQNDPLPSDKKKPVLIVSDGEEGNLVEKVILEDASTTEIPDNMSQTDRSDSTAANENVH